MTSSGITVLYVCTGNVCRSAAAERLLQAELGGRTDVVVHSAGTGALAGYGIDGPSAVALAEVGADAAGHQARWLTEDMVREADLILGATTAHRDHVLRMVPTKMRRAFTMREFARLGAGLAPAQEPDQMGHVILAVAGQRGQVEPAGPGQDDVGDPFGGDLAAARTMVAMVRNSVVVTARLLGLPARA